jgi:hypothetical protein
MFNPLRFKKTFLFASVLLLSSCENFDLFRSEDDLNKKIQARWTLVLLPASNPKEFWTFNNGIVYRETMDNPVRHDTGTYTLTTTLDDATLNIKGFKDTLSKLVAPWDIVRLDDNILFIATDKNGDPGVTQREFYK